MSDAGMQQPQANPGGVAMIQEMLGLLTQWRQQKGEQRKREQQRRDEQRKREQAQWQQQQEELRKQERQRREEKLKQEIAQWRQEMERLMQGMERRLKRGQPSVTMSTTFIDTVAEKAARPEHRLPFDLSRFSDEPFAIDLAGKHAHLWPLVENSPANLEKKAYHIGFLVNAEEASHVQPLAGLLFQHLLQEFAPNSPFVGLDIHTSESTFWGASATDIAVCNVPGRPKGARTVPNVLNPGNLAVAIEIRGNITVMNKESLPQLITNLETALVKAPMRQFVYGLLTDLLRGQLVKVECLPNGDHHFTVYDWCHGRQFLKLLRALLQSPPHQLNAAPIKLKLERQRHSTEYFAVRHLGYGVSGDIVALLNTSNNKEYAAKGLLPGRYNVNLEAELAIMSRVRELQNEYLGCRNFQPAWMTDENLKLVILMEVYDANRPDGWNHEHVGHVVDALKQLHETLRLVHRDLKPSNFLIANGHPVIIDFGCAVDVDANEPYHGSRCYAAPRFLPLGPKTPSGFRVEDDLVSFILTVFAIFHIPQGDIEHFPLADPENIWLFWKNKLPYIWMKFIRDVESRNENALKAWQAQLRAFAGYPPVQNQSEALDMHLCVKIFLQANLPSRPLWCTQEAQKRSLTAIAGKAPEGDDSIEEPSTRASESQSDVQRMTGVLQTLAMGLEGAGEEKQPSSIKDTQAAADASTDVPVQQKTKPTVRFPPIGGTRNGRQ